MSEKRRRLAGETFRSKARFAVAALTEVAAPGLRCAARVVSPRRPSPPSEWREGILVGAGHIGDILYNTGSLPVLTEALPRCRWHIVAGPPASDALANNPHIAGCGSTMESLCSAGRIDVAICYNSGNYWRDLLRAASLRIPNRVAYAHKGFSGLVTFPIGIRFPQPYPAYFADLVGEVTGRDTNWSLRPMIYTTPENEANAEQMWQSMNLQANKPVMACFMTSRQPSGVWPARKFAETVRDLERESSVQALLCGTLADEPILQGLKADLGLGAHVLAGKLDLLSLGCLLRRCAVVLCPDSGPRHLANAVRTPVVFVRNLAVRKIETGAYLETERDAAPDLECLSSSEQATAFVRLSPSYVADRIREVISNSSQERSTR